MHAFEPLYYMTGEEYSTGINAAQVQIQINVTRVAGFDTFAESGYNNPKSAPDRSNANDRPKRNKKAIRHPGAYPYAN